MCFKFSLIVLFSLVLAWLPPASAKNSLPPGGGGTGAFAYQVNIDPRINGRLRKSLLRASSTVMLKQQPPASRAQLLRRVREDHDLLNRVLRAYGYYAGQVSHRIDYEQTPINILLIIETGPKFTISEVEINKTDFFPGPPFDLPEAADLGLPAGRAAEAEAITEARTKLKNKLQANGYPFPRVRITEVLVDHANNSVAIHLACEPGPYALFGEIEISGLERVKPDYVRSRMTWQSGTRFEQPRLTQFRRELMHGDLFSIIEISSGDQLDEHGRVGITANLVERKPRTVKAGGSYQTEIGPQLNLSWAHRNLYGRGERLNFDLSLAEHEQSLTGGYRIPGFISPQYNLQIKGGYADEKTDAFRSRGFSATIRLERSLTPRLSLGGGVGYRLSRVGDGLRTKDLGLLSLPLDLDWDNRDDGLDPRRGRRFNFKLIPFADTLNPSTRFLKTQTSASNYLQIWSDRLILANRATLGTISAERAALVPPNERFFSGGGGSVRGYSYQSIGPRRDELQTGGLAQLEISSELRLQISRTSGLVLFLDGGQAYESSYPDFNQRLYWGSGIGYRHFTGFGPIRADLAFPLNRRTGIDDPFYLYLSLGQAF